MLYIFFRPYFAPVCGLGITVILTKSAVCAVFSAVTSYVVIPKSAVGSVITKPETYYVVSKPGKNSVIIIAGIYTVIPPESKYDISIRGSADNIITECAEEVVLSSIWKTLCDENERFKREQCIDECIESGSENCEFMCPGGLCLTFVEGCPVSE